MPQILSRKQGCLHFIKVLHTNNICWQKMLSKCFNSDTFTEQSSKIVITGTNGTIGFVDVHTASPMLTCDIGTGWIYFYKDLASRNIQHNIT